MKTVCLSLALYILGLAYFIAVVNIPREDPQVKLERKLSTIGSSSRAIYSCEFCGEEITSGYFDSDEFDHFILNLDCTSCGSSSTQPTKGMTPLCL